MSPKRFLKYVTVTGADDATHHNDILKITNKFPFVEFAILLRNGEPKQRYPSDDWNKKLFNLWESNQNINIACHICGSLVRDICKGNWSILQNHEFVNVLSMYSRIQLNFSPYVDNINIYEFLDGINREELRSKQIIFQLKDINHPIVATAISNNLNIAPLFDLSGGQGISPNNWPISNRFCGYAGGLNPDNINQQIHIIANNADIAWIDAESGLRTNNEFDLYKVEQFLHKAEDWVIL